MPRYYFDVEDRGLRIRDDIGLELHSDEDVRKSALAALADMARDGLPDGNDAEFRISVRDRGGNDILRSSLILRYEWAGR